MGNGYHHHHNGHLSSLMPMLCLRPSTKDDPYGRWDDVVISFSDHNQNEEEPSSPRVGCTGQIKQNKKLVGFPTDHRCTKNNNRNNNNSNKYLKLKKIFSSKNLIGTTSSTRRPMIMGRSVTSKIVDERSYLSIGFVDLDPPLPVVQRVQHKDAGSDAVSLWKRRCCGETLKGLQLQQRQLPCLLQPPSSL